MHAVGDGKDETCHQVYATLDISDRYDGPCYGRTEGKSHRWLGNHRLGIAKIIFKAWKTTGFPMNAVIFNGRDWTRSYAQIPRAVPKLTLNTGNCPLWSKAKFTGHGLYYKTCTLHL